MFIEVYDPYRRIHKNIADSDLDDFLRNYLNDIQMQHIYMRAEEKKAYVTEVGIAWMNVYVHFSDSSIVEFKIVRYK